MLRDVFYYGTKPNVHPREQFAENLEDARQKCKTEHFWIINEFCDYRNFDWDFDFEFLPDEDVWAEDHNNVWPSQHQKDSGTWLCPKEHSDLIIYRGDVDPVIRKNEKQSDNWVELDLIDHSKFDFSWHPDPTDPPYIYKWGCKFFPAELKHVLEYRVPGATQEKYMVTTVELLPQQELWIEHQEINKHKFDMSWRPNPLDPPFIYVWGNKYVDGKLQPTLEYYAPNATDKKYMPEKLEVLPEWDRWIEVQAVDKNAAIKEGFDFSWRPDPREPAYIYTWGNQYIDAELRPTLEYHCEGATERKYMTNDIPVIPEWDRWVEVQAVDKSKFDFTWRPDPREPAYIYTWGNEYIDAELKPTLEYHCEGATERKYMTNDIVVLPEWDKWVEVQAVDKSKFDFSWRPDPREPAYIYTWGNQYIDAELKATLEYHCEGATERKYMSNDVNILPEWDRWVEVQAVDKSKFDFTWRPDPREPAYIYTWGNEYIDAELVPTLEYHCEGAIERKYMSNDVSVLPEYNKWKVVENIAPDSFNFSWRPDPREPALIYVFGNQFYDAIKMPTVEYHCEGATERKYMDTMVAQIAPNPKLYEHLEDSFLTDYSWLPDPDSPPYIYVWGNQWNAPEDKISVQFVVPGATEYKYMSDRAIRRPCMDNWIVPDDVDTTGFDFSWEPSPAAPPYIYEFATQWQKTGGPQYVVPGATEKQYVDFQKVKKLPNQEGWTVPSNIDSTGFDFSWHPDATSPPYVYVFATQWAFSGGPVYTVSGATETKYVDDQVATAKKDMTNWVYDPDLIDVDSFDFSWHPYVEDQPYVYEFGTQHQKTGGPKYITSGADSSSPTKYIDTRILKATRLPHKDSKWKTVKGYKIKDFDYSWHPDTTEEPYIYVFGSNLYPAQEMPTVEYHVEGANQIKFVNDIVATLDQDMTNWEVPDDVDTTGFDFSWKPNPTDPPFIYEFGTQHQKTGGPRYVVSGATETKYLDFQKVARKSIVSDEWNIITDIDTDKFDFSWHPDATDPPYIYAWGNQWVSAEDRPSVEYRVPGATEYRYMDNSAIRLASSEHWIIPDDVDTTGFDFSWEPSPKEEPYVYQFGTQWQKTGGPKYVINSDSPVKYVQLENMQALRLPTPTDASWVTNYKIKDFDYSWHPDDTEEPYIYIFGNNFYKAEECPTIEYRMPGATVIKYVHDTIAVLDVNMDNWEVPSNIDTTDFDFSWIPKPNDPPFIYEFATQHQKTGGPKYIVKYATETKYLDSQRVTILPDLTKWDIPDYIDANSFDFSWHPDATEPAYIYQFGTQWALSGGPKYTVDGAVEVKYIDDQLATALPDRTNWVYDESLIDIDSFDFSWHPYVEDQPYIYQFGTQWQKTGGPKYITPGAEPNAPIKYVDTRIIKATRLPRKDSNWKVLVPAIEDFDYSWHPDETEEPYVYVFGNTQYPAEDMPTVTYTVPGADEWYKYVYDVVATLAPNKTNWKINIPIDESKWDFSWVPNPHDPAYIYVWGNQWNPAVLEPTVIYKVPGATEYKYMDNITAVVLPDASRFNILHPVVENSFDFSWRPNPKDPPYVYVFGNTQHSAEIMPTVEYRVADATQVKYISNIVAKLAPNKTNYKILEEIEENEFDFGWVPNPKDPPYIYVFGNTQYPGNIYPTVEYHVKGATDKKYVNNIVAKLKSNPNKFNLLHPVIKSSFDFSWRPNPKDPPYTYVFGNDQYPAEIMPTIEFVVPGATQVKYIPDMVAKLASDKTNWEIPDNIDTSSFDFSWVPDPNAPAYIYEFATFWNNRGGPKYIVSGATEYKYIEDIKAKTLPSRKNWDIPEGIDVSKFDFSWVPHPKAPPYIYQFGTKLNNNDGPRYITPGNNGEVVYLERVETDEIPEITVEKYYIETTLEDLISQHPNEIFWAVRKNIDYTDFDFTWRPGTIEVAWELEYVHVFGSMDSELTQTYFVSADHYLAGNTSFKFVEEVKLDETTLSQIFIKPDMFYVDRGNIDSAERFEQLKARFGNKIQKTRYLNSWVDTINRCINRATTEVLWVLNSELDYTNFNFEYYPNPWQMKMVHVFGTQWNHWGTTFMVNREAFPEDTKYIKIIEHLSMLNFAKEYRALATDCVYDIVVVDHGNYETSTVVELIENKVPNKNVTVVKYDQSYFNTIRNLVNRLPEKKEHYLWICSSVCDYSRFDFSYICDPFAKDNLHVFPSGKQKFGDTFLIDINKTKEIISEMESLEDYHKINFNGTVRTERLPEPVIVTSNETHVESIKNVTGFPYATLISSDNSDIEVGEIEPMSLWSNESKNIIITSTGATRIVVPAEAKDYVTKELYEYPYIKRSPKLALSSPLDIVFVSNGETVADQNYEQLLTATQGRSNRINRVDGINGRTEALHAAAESSQTPWFFCVPAKLFVNKKFDFNYQADRMQMPKHYIFSAFNPVNDLFYGHQSMVLYNKNLVLGNKGVGLDFTLDSPHMSVELNSGTIVGDTDEHSTWRTAFREAVKLKKYSANGDETSKERLAIWTTVGKGNYGEWSIKGALDGIEFYNEVEGDLAKLRQSYYWDWLQDRFKSKY